MQVVDVLVDGRRIDFLVRLEQVLKEIQKTGIHFHETSILADYFFFYQQLQFVFIVLQEAQRIRIAEAGEVSFLEKLREQRLGCGDGIDNFVYRTEYIHSFLKKNRRKITICTLLFLILGSFSFVGNGPADGSFSACHCNDQRVL